MSENENEENAGDQNEESEPETALIPVNEGTAALIPQNLIPIRQLDINKLEDLKQYPITGAYDKDGTPITNLFEWATKWEDFEYRKVQQDYLPNGLFISTVWLGQSVNMDGSDIFETMVFVEKGFMAVDCERYATEEWARKGHNLLMEKYEKMSDEEILKLEEYY